MDPQHTRQSQHFRQLSIFVWDHNLKREYCDKVNSEPTLEVALGYLSKLGDHFVLLDIFVALKPIHNEVYVKKALHNPKNYQKKITALYRESNEQYVGNARIRYQDQNAYIKSCFPFGIRTYNEFMKKVVIRRKLHMEQPLIHEFKVYKLHRLQLFLINPNIVKLAQFQGTTLSVKISDFLEVKIIVGKTLGWMRNFPVLCPGHHIQERII